MDFYSCHVTCIRETLLEYTRRDKVEEIVYEDRRLCEFDEHEESIYAKQWTSNDPWLLSSLSYDGRLILNRVPKNEKFQILLCCPTSIKYLQYRENHLIC